MKFITVGLTNDLAYITPPLECGRIEITEDLTLFDGEEVVASFKKDEWLSVTSAAGHLGVGILTLLK